MKFGLNTEAHGSNSLHWRSKQCKSYLEVKCQILKKVHAQVDEICGLHERLSLGYLQLADLFRELDYHATALEFKWVHTLDWKKKYKEFRKQLREGASVPRSNAWRQAMRMAKQWGVFQKVWQVELQRDLIRPVQLFAESCRSIQKDVFEVQEAINHEFLFEEKRLNQKKQKLLATRDPRDWALYDNLHNRADVVEGLLRGERWGLDVVCWQHSSLVRHLKGVFENTNFASLFQLQNLRMFEQSLLSNNFLDIRNSLEKHKSLLLDF